MSGTNLVGFEAAAEMMGLSPLELATACMRGQVRMVVVKDDRVGVPDRVGIRDVFLTHNTITRYNQRRHAAALEELVLTNARLNRAAQVQGQHPTKRGPGKRGLARTNPERREP